MFWGYAPSGKFEFLAYRVVSDVDTILDHSKLILTLKQSLLCSNLHFAKMKNNNFRRDYTIV